MCRAYVQGNVFRDKRYSQWCWKIVKFWSKWVDNAWDEICSHAVNLNSVKYLFDINEHIFIVWDANNKSDIWKVYYFDDKTPECECGIFISSKVRFNSFFSLFYLKFIYWYYILITVN